MQCGFAFLEAGAVRSKNCTNIIIKNVLDSLLGILGYWAIGWALAFGSNPYEGLEPFFGFSQFFIVGLKNYAKFFFQFVFAATASVTFTNIILDFFFLHRPSFRGRSQRGQNLPVSSPTLC